MSVSWLISLSMSDWALKTVSSSSLSLSFYLYLMADWALKKQFLLLFLLLLLLSLWSSAYLSTPLSPYIYIYPTHAVRSAKLSPPGLQEGPD